MYKFPRTYGSELVYHRQWNASQQKDRGRKVLFPQKIFKMQDKCGMGQKKWVEVRAITES